MSQKPKDIIIQILDLVGYGENKERFADELLSLCQQQALVDLVKSLPEEKQILLEKTLSQQPNPQNIDQVLKENFSEEEILEALKKATQNTIQAYLQTISPHLSDLQKNNLQTYIQSLTG
ncbi:MAG: hypothetical protein PHV63_03460 [Candidatus Daviesbacteria bacterium]|nr:hypothetical protein [Candidatus Daviesbacteria bacterium]